MGFKAGGGHQHNRRHCNTFALPCDCEIMYRSISERTAGNGRLPVCDSVTLDNILRAITFTETEITAAIS